VTAYLTKHNRGITDLSIYRTSKVRWLKSFSPRGPMSL